jgi:Skp family chaperone for outer membrane proteins
MTMAARPGGSGGVLRLRNLAMVENIRRAEDPAWRERLERQQVVARLGRMFGRVENPLQAMQDHADALKEELRRTPLRWRNSKSRDEAGG